MEDGIEYAMETVVGGIMFCMAVVLLILLFTAFGKSMDGVEKTEEQLILYEEKGEG